MQLRSKGAGLFTAIGSNGEVYVIDTDCGTCTCRGWFYKKHCKHLDEARRREC